jgi:hypothetical protein
MKFSVVSFGIIANLMIGMAALAHPIQQQSQFTLTEAPPLQMPHQPVDHFDAQANDDADGKFSKAEKRDVVAVQDSTAQVEPNGDSESPPVFEMEPPTPQQVGPVEEDSDLQEHPDGPLGGEPGPAQAVDPKDRCVFAEYYVKFGQTPQLVTYYQNYLETHCRENGPTLQEKCEWLEEQKAACKTALPKVQPELEAATPLSDGIPEVQPVEKPELKKEPQDCGDYQEWYTQICVTPPVAPPAQPTPPKHGTGPTPAAPNYALSGGACSLSGAGATTDAGMGFVVASLVGLFALGRRKR